MAGANLMELERTKMDLALIVDDDDDDDETRTYKIGRMCSINAYNISIGTPAGKRPPLGRPRNSRSQ
jgi:hypothetical protein